MKYTVLLILLITTNIYAGPVDGLEKEFSQIEEHYKQDAPSDADKTRVLEKNLVSAVRLSLVRRFLNYDEKIKNLTPANISYQLISETSSCYVKYEQFYIFYKFYKDPRTYAQSPVFESFYIKPENLKQPHEPAKKN